MNDLKEKTTNLADHVEDLADTFYKLAVVNVTQKTTSITSSLIGTILICTFGFFFLLFGGLALSWWLGSVVGNRAAGFLLGGAFFLVVMVVLLAMRKKIIFPYFRDLIIRKFYD
jgi:hypothetical protein